MSNPAEKVRPSRGLFMCMHCRLFYLMFLVPQGSLYASCPFMERKKGRWYPIICQLYDHSKCQLEKGYILSVDVFVAFEPRLVEARDQDANVL